MKLIGKSNTCLKLGCDAAKVPGCLERQQLAAGAAPANPLPKIHTRCTSPLPRPSTNGYGIGTDPSIPPTSNRAGIGKLLSRLALVVKGGCQII